MKVRGERGRSALYILYSEYFSGGKMFVSSEFLASLWKIFRGCSTVRAKLYGNVSWIQISWLPSQPRKPQKFSPRKIPAIR